MGAFWLKTPGELGGTPLHPLEFCNVIEEMAYADVSTAWACMIGNGCAGMVGGWLPEASAQRLFPPGGPLPIVAGQPQPRGMGRAVSGGYVVSGRWSFASGILHSAWLIGAFKLDSDGQRMLAFVIPKDEAEVIDNWQVAGLQGTGSLDFSTSELFVPEEQTYDRPPGPCAAATCSARKSISSWPMRCPALRRDGATQRALVMARQRACGPPWPQPRCSRSRPAPR
jgi:indole-3-acetate monooxygenase